MSGSERPYVLAESTWKLLGATRYEVAILPWGATEAHNRHLPYGTDTIEVEWLAAEAARQAWEQGARVTVLPPIPFGVNTTQLDIPLTINLNPTTQLAVLTDVVASLERHGVAKLVVFNGHGGNDFRWMIRELQPHTRLLLCTLNWWQIGAANEFFAEPGEHAGELETSVMLHVAPELVRPLAEAGSGRQKRNRIRAFREGWAWMPRPWTQVTDDTGIGNPAASSREKGERFAAAVTRQIADFIAELAAADPANLYE